MAASRHRIEFSPRAAKAYRALAAEVRRRMEPKILGHRRDVYRRT